MAFVLRLFSVLALFFFPFGCCGSVFLARFSHDVNLFFLLLSVTIGAHVFLVRDMSLL